METRCARAQGWALCDALAAAVRPHLGRGCKPVGYHFAEVFSGPNAPLFAAVERLGKNARKHSPAKKRRRREGALFDDVELPSASKGFTEKEARDEENEEGVGGLRAPWAGRRAQPRPQTDRPPQHSGDLGHLPRRARQNPRSALAGDRATELVGGPEMDVLSRRIMEACGSGASIEPAAHSVWRVEAHIAAAKGPEADLVALRLACARRSHTLVYVRRTHADRQRRDGTGGGRGVGRSYRGPRKRSLDLRGPWHRTHGVAYRGGQLRYRRYGLTLVQDGVRGVGTYRAHREHWLKMAKQDRYM